MWGNIMLKNRVTGLVGSGVAVGLLALTANVHAAMSESPSYSSYVNASVSNTYPYYNTQYINSLPSYPSANITLGSSFAKVQSAAFDANTGFSFTTSQQYDASGSGATKSWVYGYLFITVDTATTVTYNASINLSTTGTAAASLLSISILDAQTNAYFGYKAVTNGSGNVSLTYTLQPGQTYKIGFQEQIDPKSGASGLTTANTSFDFSLGTGAVPEPASLGILGTSAVALLLRRRK